MYQYRILDNILWDWDRNAIYIEFEKLTIGKKVTDDVTVKSFK